MNLTVFGRFPLRARELIGIFVYERKTEILKLQVLTLYVPRIVTNYIKQSNKMHFLCIYSTIFVQLNML